MAEMKTMQMLMGHYDGLTVKMEANYQEALATSQAETKPDKEEEGTKQEHVKIKLTTVIGEKAVAGQRTRRVKFPAISNRDREEPGPNTDKGESEARKSRV